MYPPAMSKLAKQYLSVPASSRPVERLFSVTGNIFVTRKAKTDLMALEIFDRPSPFNPLVQEIVYCINL